MKKLNIIYAFIAVMFFTACDDAIDIQQPGRLDADAAFQSVNDLRLGLLGAYNELDITDMITFNSTFTDEMSIGFDNGGQGLGDGRYGHILNSTTAIASDVWVDQYDAINASTRVIEAAKAITPQANEQDGYDNIIGQAHAIRAFAHFQLFSYYTTDYTDDSALCVIGVDFIPTIDQQLARSTNGEVLNIIESDLGVAEGLLSANSNDPTFIGQDFITALRARLAAYRQDYASAASLAKSLTDKYPLANQDQYFAMFDDMDNTEVIFKLERSMGDDYDTQATEGGGWAGALYAFVNATKDGGPYFEMSRSLFNLFDEDDIRLSRNIDPSSDINPDYATDPDPVNTDVLVIRKYPGSEGQPLMNDLKVFRASEMVLIEAEAAAATGDLDGAANFIKELRDARLGSPQAAPSFGSAEAAFRAILDERRQELCFEAHRYLDLKRLGVRAGVSIDRDPIDCSPYNACSIQNTDHRWTLPIPTVELNANATIRDQQNPGY